MTEPFNAPVTEGKDFETCPAGPQALVCGDVVFLGKKLCPHSGKEKTYIRLVWFTEALDSGDRQYMINERCNFIFALSEGKQSALYSRWVDCFGTMTVDQAKVADLNRFIGVQVQANITNSEDGKWANIKALMPNPSGAVQIPEGYKRVQDRTDDQGQAKLGAAAPAQAYGETTPVEREALASAAADDDIPF